MYHSDMVSGCLCILLFADLISSVILQNHFSVLLLKQITQVLLEFKLMLFLNLLYFKLFKQALEI